MVYLIVFRDLDGKVAGYQETKAFSDAREILKGGGGEVYIRVGDIEEFQQLEKLAQPLSPPVTKRSVHT